MAERIECCDAMFVWIAESWVNCIWQERGFSLFQYWMSTGSRFIIDWIIFCNHILCAAFSRSREFISEMLQPTNSIQYSNACVLVRCGAVWCGVVWCNAQCECNVWVNECYVHISFGTFLYNVEHCVISRDATFPLLSLKHFGVFIFIIYMFHFIYIFSLLLRHTHTRIHTPLMKN